MTRFFYSTLLLLFPFFPLLAQSPVSVFWEPELSYSWKGSGNWAYNTKLGGRPGGIENKEFSSQLNRINASFFATRTLFGGKKLSGGYTFRLFPPYFEEGYGYEHRFTQQFAFLSYLGEKRLAHRIRLEQRVRSTTYENRLRYQLSYEFPLQGDQLDPGEKYMVLSEEAVFAFNIREFEPENRLYAGIGWYFSDKYQFETGLQYRTEDIRSDLSHLLQLATVFYFSR